MLVVLLRVLGIGVLLPTAMVNLTPGAGKKCLLFTLVFAVTGSVACCQITSEEIVRQWGMYQEGLPAFARKLTVNYTDPDRKPVEFLVLEVHRDGAHLLNRGVTSDVPGQPREHTMAANPDYVFGAAKHVRSGNWFQENLSRNPGESPILIFAAPLLRLIPTMGYDARSLCRTEGFGIRVLNVSETDVVIEMQPTRKGEAVIKKATLVLDRNAYCVIKSGTIDAAPQTIQVENQYEVVDGYPFCTKQTFNVSVPGDRVVWTSEYEPIAERDFRSETYLTHYGLPEPPSQKTPGGYRTPAWMYYTLAGMLLLLGGGGLWYLINRKGA